MSWFEKLMPSRIRTEGGNKKAVPEGLWAKCPSCNAVLYRAEMERNMEVCPKCGYHNRIGARRRLDLFLDDESREEIGAELEPGDPLKFKDSKKYKDRLSAAQKKSGEKDALVVMRGQLKGREIVAAAFEFSFMGGSMGSVVGERFGWSTFVGVMKKLTPTLAVLAVAMSYAFSGRMGFDLFPKVESDFSQASVVLPYGAPVSRTEAVMQMLLQGARQVVEDSGHDELVTAITADVGTVTQNDTWGTWNW